MGMDYDKLLTIMKDLKPAINRTRYYAEQVEKYGTEAAAAQGLASQTERDRLVEELRAVLA